MFGVTHRYVTFVFFINCIKDCDARASSHDDRKEDMLMSNRPFHSFRYTVHSLFPVFLESVVDSE